MVTDILASPPTRPLATRFRPHAERANIRAVLRHRKWVCLDAAFRVACLVSVQTGCYTSSDYQGVRLTELGIRSVHSSSISSSPCSATSVAKRRCCSRPRMILLPLNALALVCARRFDLPSQGQPLRGKPRHFTRQRPRRPRAPDPAAADRVRSASRLRGPNRKTIF